jgi:nitroreductase
MGGTPDQTYAEVVLSRRSIRGYLDKPVPRALIEEVLTLAMRSPSSMNTQPYHFHIVTGEPLDRIRKGNTERILAGEPDSREFRRGEPFAGVHRDRQVGVAKQLFAAMGIERDDKDARPRAFRLRRHRLRLRRSDDRAGQRGMVARAGLRDQFARDHAKSGGARTRRHS